MLTTEQCRALLSTKTDFSDNELEELIKTLYATAELAFDVYWFDSNSGSKNPFGLLDNNERDTSI